MKNSEEVKTNDVEEKDEKELTDDELYAKIQTEKLMKRRKTKRITTFAGLCVAMVLAIVVIIMAAVPVSFKPNCIQSGFDSVSFIANNASPQLYNKGEKGYNEFMKYYNKAFSQTFFSALFSGALNSYNLSEDYNTNKDVSLDNFKSLAGTGNYLVKLHFDGTEEDGRVVGKKLTNQDGSVYRSRYWNHNKVTGYDNSLTFNDAYVVVNKDGGFQTTKIFVVVSYPEVKSNKLTGNYEQRYVEITVKADTSVIYNAWENLIRVQA